MSDTGTPTSGTETPSPFLMGTAPPPDDDARFDKAVEDVFGKRPQPDEQPGGDETETTETPAETPAGTSTGDQSQVAGQASQGDEGEGEGQGPAGDGRPAGTGSETEPDPLALYRARYGREPTGAEMQGLIALADWASGLTPEQQQAIDRALFGGGQEQEPPPPQPDPIREQIEELEDPVLKAIYERQQATEAQLQAIAQANAREAETRVVLGLETGANRFKEQYQVSDSELAGLQSAFAQARLLPGFVNAYQDPAEAMFRGLDYLYWNTPTFRDREIQRQIEARQAQEQNHQQRKAKASSVTGTGGNGASRTQAAPTTPDGHLAALTQGLREAMNNGQG